MFLNKEDASSGADVNHIKEVGAFGCLVTWGFTPTKHAPTLS